MTYFLVATAVLWGAVCGVLCLVVGVRGAFRDLQETRYRVSRAEQWTERVVFLTLALAGAVTTFVMVSLASFLLVEFR